MTGRQARTIQFDDALIDIFYGIGELPLTVRQVYYVCTSEGLVPKNKNGDRLVTRRLSELRDLGEIPWGHIIDPTREIHQRAAHRDLGQFFASARRRYSRDLWQSQPHRVELWVESDSTRGFLEPVADEYGLPIISTRGQASGSLIFDAAQQADAYGKPVRVLYVGDWDPTGTAIPRSVVERSLKFGVDLEEFTRLAVNAEQIVGLGLQSQPDAVKPKDPNFKAFAEECRQLGLPVEGVQAEAIPPGLLRGIVRDAIEERIDQEAWEREEALWKEEVTQLVILDETRKELWGGDAA